MSNRFGTVIATIALLILSVWGVSSLLTMTDERAQFGVIGVALGIILILTIKPGVSLDFKLMIFCLFGYFIGGKGFAYLSPAPPVYIGEICLAAALVAFGIRRNFDFTVWLRQHWLMAFLMLCFFLATIRAYFDYRIYGLWAIRDFSMIYYSLFAALAVEALRNERFRNLFQTVYTKALLLGCGVFVVSHIFQLKPLFESVSFGIISPHVDVAAPVLSASAVYFALKFERKRSMLYLVLLLGLIAFIFTQKTAFPFCFILTATFLLLAGRVRSMLTCAMIGMVSLMIILPIDLALGLGVTDRVLGSETLSTFTELSAVAGEGVASTDAGTTGWRLEWWRIVYEDTVDINPYLGQGFGADITTPFLKEFYKIEDLDPQRHGYARYPHNIILTLFGRMGAVGVILFCLYSALFIGLCVDFCRKKIRHNPSALDLTVIAFVFAGFCNAFVQANFEVPFAAILHWVSLGYLIYRVREREQISEVGIEKEAIC